MAVRDTSALWAPVPQKSAHGKTASGKQTGNQAGGWGHGKRTWSSSSQPFRIGRSVPEWHPSAVGPQRAHAQSPPQAQGLRAVGRGGGGWPRGRPCLIISWDLREVGQTWGPGGWQRAVAVQPSPAHLGTSSRLCLGAPVGTSYGVSQ